MSLRYVTFSALTVFAHPALAETPSRGIVEVVGTGDITHTFQVEIADEPGEQSRGLMFRESVPDGAGMLFLYDSPRRTAFWMKNTPVSLDMLFIGTSGEVIKLARETTPLSTTPIPSEEPVIGVLEIGGGDAEALGINVGARIRWTELPSEK